ncbi:MAG: Uma2 family endonuclease [Thermoleophilia bacterium]|nr:Uma2 family endonuclease [Thermoleophilia bacterium]
MTRARRDVRPTPTEAAAMSILTSPHELPAEAGPPRGAAPSCAGDQRVVLGGVGWDGYRALLRLRGEGSRPRMVYLDGDVVLMSPAYRHERLAERLGYLVLALAEELDRPCLAAGHTTFRRRPKRGGAEADKAFYLANTPNVLGRDRLDLRRDPPPDLVIEVENTHPADESLEVWRRLGVPEVWVVSAEAARVLVRGPDGAYAESPQSAAFPEVASSEIHAWGARSGDDSETAWVRALRRWVVEEVTPRRAAGGGGPG